MVIVVHVDAQRTTITTIAVTTAIATTGIATTQSVTTQVATTAKPNLTTAQEIVENTSAPAVVWVMISLIAFTLLVGIAVVVLKRKNIILYKKGYRKGNGKGDIISQNLVS